MVNAQVRGSSSLSPVDFQPEVLTLDNLFFSHLLQYGAKKPSQDMGEQLG